ncbi:8352_t:CDS:2 [Funneliformis geosporum]|nr:8352_t:CDS:2 [Funneliformis geosporum]
MENSEVDNDDESEICSQSSCIRNIKLRKPLSIQNAKIEIDAVSFQTDLALIYNSFGYHTLLINKTCNFYEQVSYLHNTQNNEIPLNLNTNDVVMIQVADYGESYVIIKEIFKHKSNDGYYYPFIYELV